MEKAKKPANYTPEVVEKLVARYNELQPTEGNACLETLAKEFDKPVRSIRMKLVQQEVYVKDNAPAKATKEDGPSKKELVKELCDVTGLDLAGIEGAPKAAIAALITFARERVAEAESDASDLESEADESEVAEAA